MKRVAVDSDDLRSVGYDPEKQILEVELHSGETFQYFDVSESLHRALMGSPAKERFLQYCIKGIYQVENV